MEEKESNQQNEETEKFTKDDIKHLSEDEYLTEEDLQDLNELGTKEPKPKIEVDEEEWALATEEDLKEERVRKLSKIYLIPLNEEKQTYIKLFMRDASVEEQLSIVETLLTFDDKKGIRLDMKSYYKLIWNRLVTNTEPKITFNVIRFFNTKFGNRLLSYLPNPIELLGESLSGIKPEEIKN